MAPAGSAYLPPLAECLDAPPKLLSWQTIAKQLRSSGDHSLNQATIAFLQDPASIKALTNCFTTSTWNAQSKADLETRTSAINVAPNSRYDLKEIKEDVAWIGAETDTDEATALRLVILEWQSRSAEQASLNADEVGNKEFQTTRSRRQRILRIYFSEAQWLSRCVEAIVAQGVYGASQSKKHKSRIPSVVIAAARSIQETWNINPETAPIGTQSWLQVIHKRLQKSMDTIESGTSVLTRESMQDYIAADLDLLAAETSLIQLVHGFQIILLIQWSLPSPSSSILILEWFQWMDTLAFFQRWQSLSTYLAAYVRILTELSVFVSLSFIDLAAAIEIVPHLVNTSAISEGKESQIYLQSDKCMKELNEIILRHVMSSNEIAAPAGIAWCALVSTIQGYAAETNDHREERQNQKQIDQLGASESSDNDSTSKSSKDSRRSAQRRHSASSDASSQSTIVEAIDKAVKEYASGEDIIQQAGKCAVIELRGFHILENVSQTALSRLDHDSSPELTNCIREVILQFILMSLELGSIVYSEQVLKLVFTALGAQDSHWKFRTHALSMPYPFQPQYSPLREDPLLQSVLSVARGRFPLEGAWFIQLCEVILPFHQSTPSGKDPILEILTDLETLTALVTEPGAPYGLNDDGETIQVELLQSYDVLAMMFPALCYNRATDEDVSGSLVIPDGTMGKALKEDKPLVVLWNFKYSALRYFGLCLQLLLQRRTEKHDRTSYYKLYLLCTKIIGLIGTWVMKIAVTANPDYAVEEAESLLANISDDLERSQDIVTVILTLLEGELQKTISDPSAAEFVLKSLQFVIALARVSPNRVWSFLGRSGMLGLDGKESRLTAIVSGFEMTSGKYNILVSSIQLLDALLEDSLRGGSFSQTPSTALKRFRAAEQSSFGSGIQAITKKKILERYIHIALNVVESSATWTFNNPEDKASLKIGIYSILHKIISYTYNYDDESPVDRKLCSNLALATALITDGFLSDAPNDTLLQPLFDDLVYTALAPQSSMPTRLADLQDAVASQALGLMSQLVRLNLTQGKPTSHLASKIHKNIQALVALFATREELRLPIVNTLNAAIRDVGNNPRALPILAVLSESAAKAFCQSLTTLGLPATDPALSAATWSLFASIVRHNQQWFAVYLLSGMTPRENLKTKDGSRKNSAIQIALVKMNKIDTLDEFEAINLLEFVALAGNLWVSVIHEIVNDKECQKSCLKYLSNLQHKRNDTHELGENVPRQLQIASHIVNILALLAHQANRYGNNTALRHIVPHIGYLRDHAAEAPQYNASLHHGLQRNFERLFPGSTLQNFKRTSFSQPVLGNLFYYDTRLAKTAFRDLQAWSGKQGRGMESEFTRANINLSLVEAQVALFHSWKSLVVELSEGLSTDASFQATMITVIKTCLEANASSSMPESIFKQLCATRADLAFTLLQILVINAPDRNDAQALLATAWATLQPHTGELGLSLASGDADYVRSLLRILYLTLSINADSSNPESVQESPYTGIVLSILDEVVARGFRSLIGQVHAAPSSVQPQDFALVTALLRAALRVPGITNHSERLLAHFADEKTIQHAGTLVSWADQLLVNGDPIFGELSIAFLRELSSIQVLAEAIMVSGVYAQISSTTLFSYFRTRNGCGPFENPSRIYNIWSRGYLPLTLNILGAVGAPVAIEVATTLEQFAPQLKRASLQFDPKAQMPTNGRVSLSMIQEAHSLALLYLVFNKFREAGPSIGLVVSDLPALSWDASSVKEDIESLLGRRQTLRDTIVALDEREESLAHIVSSNKEGDSQNKLEEKIVDEIHAALALLGAFDESNGQA